jgi:integrase
VSDPNYPGLSVGFTFIKSIDCCHWCISYLKGSGFDVDRHNFAIIQQTTGVHRLMLQLLYGSGLRLRECMELRIKDIDFAQSQMVIRCGKGGKDRVTLLPQSVIEPLQIHIQQVRLIHQQDKVSPT